uniref:ABC transporter permease n=1 Tax=Eubacterium cellulosolvens TaxID=29322 RepID=UPI00048415BB|nr:ABC transporter permease [[Eubacterium] cellulosolvens]
MKEKIRNMLPPVLLSGLLLAAWQIGAGVVKMTHIFPGPLEILAKTWELRETLFLKQLPTTLITILAGWILAAALGIALATLMHFSGVAEAMLHPALVITQTIPVMCISPLFVLWFGYTVTARLVAVVLSTFFAITLNTFDGLARADREKIELMKSMGARRRDIFFHMEVPSAFPMFVTGLKMTLPWAVIDAAVAEWLGATQGLGYFSRRMIIRMDGAAVFAPVLILTGLALLGMAALGMLDRKCAGYRAEL